MFGNNRKKAKSLFDKAVKLESNGMYNDAYQLLNQALQKDSSFSYAYNELAWILAIHNQRLEDAFKYAFKAIELANDSNDNAIFHDTLAEIYAQKGDIDKAIESFQKSLTLSNTIDLTYPDYSASYRLSRCFIIKQDYNNAYFYLRQALNQNTINPYIYSTMGDVCIILENYLIAIENFEIAINNAPKWNFNFPIRRNLDERNQRQFFLYSCWVNLGVAHYNINEHNLCRIDNEEAYKIYKYDPTSIINLASLAAERCDRNTVQRLLEEGIPLINPLLHTNLMQSLLITSFEEYREIVLKLLRNHKKITQKEYDKYMEHWQKNRSKSSQKIIKIDKIGSVGVISETSNIKEIDMPNKKIVYGDNVKGDKIGRDKKEVNGNLYEAGHDINFGSIQNKEDLSIELEKLKVKLDELRQKEKDEEIKDSIADAHNEISKAIDYTKDNPNPSKNKLKDYLNKGKNSIENFTYSISGIKSIIDAFREAVNVVEQIM